MRYFRTAGDDGPHVIVARDETHYDLTAGPDRISSVYELAAAARLTGETIDEVTGELLADAPTVDTVDDPLPPYEIEEAWAAGVTYAISEQAREEESSMADVYLRVFDHERPELFFKATGRRLVGPNDAVGIRADSTWDVPEPELAVVLWRGEPIGYTIGNDMSSRSIEGENPLYLPQAKVYDRCCAVGPCLASADEIGDPHELVMSMQIRRDDEVVFDDETNTDQMVRTCEELTSYLTRHNDLPDRTVLLTGTSLVPPESFTLHPGDTVDITIENIGTLSNHVVEV